MFDQLSLEAMTPEDRILALKENAEKTVTVDQIRFIDELALNDQKRIAHSALCELSLSNNAKVHLMKITGAYRPRSEAAPAHFVSSAH